MTPSKPPMRANRDSGNSAPTWRRVPSDKRDGATKPFGQMNMPPRRAWLTFAIILLLNYLLMSVLFPSPDTSITIPYTGVAPQRRSCQTQGWICPIRKGPLQRSGGRAALRSTHS